MKIKEIIKQNGYTLSKVASEMGITQGALSLSINGNPTIETLRKIANVIGCSMSVFFADEDDSNGLTAICPHCGKPIKIKIE